MYTCGRTTYHATIREGMRKYKQIINSKLVWTCKVLGGSQISEINVNGSFGQKSQCLPGSVLTELIESDLQQFWLSPYTS